MSDEIEQSSKKPDFLHVGRSEDRVKAVYTDDNHLFVVVDRVTLAFTVEEFLSSVDILNSVKLKLQMREPYGSGSEASTKGG